MNATTDVVDTLNFKHMLRQPGVDPQVIEKSGFADFADDFRWQTGKNSDSRRRRLVQECGFACLAARFPALLGIFTKGRQAGCCRHSRSVIPAQAGTQAADGFRLAPE